MKSIKISFIVVFSQYADVILKVEWNEEMMEKLKLVNPTICIKVGLNGKFDKNNMEIMIMDKGCSTNYWVHEEDIPKISYFIENSRDEIIERINSTSNAS
ncbi:hypothetical protein MZM54_02540 [[Brevibacterium] frigoritolerans]|nr:hypothetical protein [Peribacillus frigoritolerans]